MKHKFNKRQIVCWIAIDQGYFIIIFFILSRGHFVVNSMYCVYDFI